MPPSQARQSSSHEPLAVAPARSASPASGGRGNEFAQGQLRERGNLAYVDMGVQDKAGYLASLYATPASQKTFADRGFDGQDQAKLAGIMQNEGGRNERRRMLGQHYRSAARTLVGKLTRGGWRDLSNLAGAAQDTKLKLTEDERAVLEGAIAGKVDLDDLQESRKSLTEVGIAHQGELFDEYSALEARQRGGEKLTRPEQTRMGALKGRSLQSSGTFGDARGMSGGRFREMYAEGQSRFEPKRFAQSRNNVEAWIAGGEKGDGRNVGAGGERASSWVGRHPEARTGDHDALADAETSWGTAQIMGHYADRGDLHRADGSEFTMRDMKASGRRLSPTTTDVDLQIAYFRDVVGTKGHLGSAQDLSTQYNGPEAPPSYADGLRANAERYQDAVRRGQHFPLAVDDVDHLGLSSERRT